MKRYGKTSESGAALISVLCLIFTAGVLVTASMAISKAGSFNVTAHVRLQRSMLVGEGVANRVQWLIAADRELYTSTERLGETVYDDYDSDRYIADMVPHVIDYYGEEVQFTISDARSGVDLNSGAYAANLRNMAVNRDDDSEWTDALDVLQAQIKDYIDSDDDTSDDGLENPDYDERKMAPLPRNGAPQFREEFLYLPGFRDIFETDRHGRLSAIRLIPPENTVSLSGTPSFLSATPDMLKAYCNLEDEEITEVTEAIKAWIKDRTPLSESIDPLMLSRLYRLSWYESGNYTVTVEASPEAKRPFKRLTFSFPAYSIAGPADKKVRYLEWMYY